MHSINIFVNCSIPTPMLPIKKQFQPLLSSISELIQPQNLIIVMPTWRQGYIKKEKALNSDWKKKKFCFQYVPYQTLTCEIYDEKGTKLEEKVDLSVAKLSKRCSQVDNRICFGLVSPNSQKYLIALKSNRQCLNIFNHVSSAKKILKTSMFKSQLQNQKENIDNSQTQKEKELEYKLRKQSTKSEEEFQQFQLEQKSSLVKTKQSLLQPYRLLQNLKGYKLIKEFGNGNLYQNKQKAAKITMLIQSLQQPSTILDHLWQLDVWNSKVKRFNKIATIEPGLYKFYLQFHKQGCFSSNKCCVVLLSLLEIDRQFYMSISTVTTRPEHISGQNWVNINVKAMIRSRTSNPKEKEIFINLESSNHGHLMRQFGNQMQNLSDYLKCKVKGEQRQLQIRAVE